MSIFSIISDWFPTHFPAFVTSLNSEVERIDVAGLSVVSPYEVLDDFLEADGVHLKAEPARLFLEGLGQFLDGVMNPADSTLVDDEPISVDIASDSEITISEPETTLDSERLKSILQIVKANSRLLNSVRPLSNSVALLSRRSDELESSLRVRRQQDNLVFARIKEGSDFEVNCSREDRVVISRLKKGPNGSHEDKKAHFKEVVQGLIAKACPDLDPPPEILDILVTLRRDQESPVVEVKFQSTSCASSFRKICASLAKAKHPDFESLFFSNSVTQATRVRIEILRAIAKKLSTETETAYVQGFTSRPIMYYNVVDSMPSHCSGTGRGYTFTDGVSRFGDLLCALDLSAAYKRAGNTFKGAMEHYFVVLKEGTASAVNRAPLGNRGRAPGHGNFSRFRGQSRGARGTSLPSSSRKRGSGEVSVDDSQAPTPAKKRSDTS
jgi:hypothetical protein